MKTTRGSGLHVRRWESASRGSPAVLCSSCGTEIEAFADATLGTGRIRLWQHIGGAACDVARPYDDADAARRLARAAIG